MASLQGMAVTLFGIQVCPDGFLNILLVSVGNSEDIEISEIQVHFGFPRACRSSSK